MFFKTAVYFSLSFTLLASSEVEVCYAPTRFSQAAPVPVGEGLDLIAHGLRVRHTWIRTAHLEAGQGPRAGIPVMTEWTDQSGNGDQPGNECYPVPACDEACIESYMIPGNFTGIYGPLNTCQDLVVRVLTDCGCQNQCVETRTSWPGGCALWAFPPLGHPDYLGLLPR